MRKVTTTCNTHHRRTARCPGDYLVSITTFREAEEDEDGNLIEAQPETVPARYNLETELTATVEEGGGPYDFQLELGDVIQPIEPTDDE